MTTGGQMKGTGKLSRTVMQIAFILPAFHFQLCQQAREKWTAGRDGVVSNSN